MPVMPSEEEEKFFVRAEADRRRKLREGMELAARELEEKERVARAAGTEDLSVADRIRAMGFDSKTARILEIVPMVLVAWADGSISKKERVRVMEAVEAAGNEPHGEAWLLAASMLEQRPSDTLATELMHVLRDLVGQDTARRENLVGLCVSVAEASGGLFGLTSRVDEKEREAIERISGAFADKAWEQVQGKLK
ncbi:MAG: TerB family tellurite resistance protein [Planctomycetota bacterium]|jgi:uncharacterized membrane protein YebE (DUF533 family)